MKTLALVLPLALALLAPAAAAQSNTSDLRVTVEPGFLVEPPGSLIHVNVSISNPTARLIAVNLSAAPSNSTKILTSMQHDARIPAGSAVRVELKVFVPNGTPVGEQPIVVAAVESPTTSPTPTLGKSSAKLDLRVDPASPRDANAIAFTPTDGTAPKPTPTAARPTLATPVAKPTPAPETQTPLTPSPEPAAPAPDAPPRGIPTLVWWGAAGVAVTGGAAGLAAALRSKRALVLLSPLYTRLAKARILDQPTRERIASAIRDEPGITFGELQRKLGLAAGTLTHHAHKLEQAGVVFSSPDGQTRRFFHVGQGRVEAVAPLRERALRVLSARAMTLSQLALELGESKQAVHYHVKRLQEDGKVQASPQGELFAK